MFKNKNNRIRTLDDALVVLDMWEGFGRTFEILFDAILGCMGVQTLVLVQLE